jgi:hypothetical protein
MVGSCSVFVAAAMAASAARLGEPGQRRGHAKAPSEQLIVAIQ